jgi:hypothetical protein
MYDSQKTLVIDVDDTICTSTKGFYDQAKVVEHSRDYINKWYDLGWYIIIFSARYYSLFGPKAIDKIYAKGYNELRWWLDKNGFKYHEIQLGKPSAKYYIDNAAWRIDNTNGVLDWAALDVMLKVSNEIN